MVEEDGGSRDGENGGRDGEAGKPDAEPGVCGLLLGEEGWFEFRCGGCLQRCAAGRTHGKVLENAMAFAVQQSVFGKRGQLIRVGVKIGLLTLSQLRAQRVGGNWFHDADPSLL